MLKEYSQVYFDECHHAASDSAMEVLQEINAKYVYGVTATPKRGDGKEKINELLIGPVRYRFTAKDRAEEQNIDHLVYPRFTRTVKTHRLSKTPYGNDAFELIRNNDVRDEQIVRDVADCVKAGRTPVVLTKYVDHAKKLSERLKTYADRVILLTGADGTKARRAQVEELHQVKDSESLILVGTGSLLGEGFDFPRLDTLFMATPVSGESVVEQYVGRLNRDYEGKENVIVYDYVDSHIPKFDKMYAARLRAYKKIGYELCVNACGEKQVANAIYDMESYAEIYWRDIEEAISDVIISSPRLNNQKVNHLIALLGKRQELGVKVTIVTWHPDAYKYGRDDDGRIRTFAQPCRIRVVSQGQCLNVVFVDELQFSVSLLQGRTPVLEHFCQAWRAVGHHITDIMAVVIDGFSATQLPIEDEGCGEAEPRHVSQCDGIARLFLVHDSWMYFSNARS